MCRVAEIRACRTEPVIIRAFTTPKILLLFLRFISKMPRDL